MEGEGTDDGGCSDRGIGIVVSPGEGRGWGALAGGSWRVRKRMPWCSCNTADHLAILGSYCVPVHSFFFFF